MKRFFSILLSIGLFFMITIPVFAEQSKVPYSVQTYLPENQVNKNATYFDLEVEKKQEQTLEVEVFNKSEEEIVVDIEANTGATNSNGLLIYDGSITKFDESLEYDFTDIAKVETTEIRLKPKSSEIVRFYLTMPDQTFDGTILGGLHFLFENDPDEDQDSPGIQIKNNYAYEIAVLLEDKDSKKEIEPDLELNHVNPELINDRTGLNVILDNVTPTLLTNTEVYGAVYKKDKKLYERNEDNFSIAPNARFNFPISFDNERLKAGDYIYKGRVKSEEDTWTFEEEFTISKDQADGINERAVELSGISYWLVGLFILAIIAIIGISAFLIKSKKNKQ